MNFSENKPLLIGGGIVVGAIIAWLAFGFFGIQSAFLDDEVEEAGPVFASGAESEEFDAAMTEAEENPVEVDEETMEGEVVTQFAGSFSGNSRYTIVGEALVLNDGTEQRFLRFENFESSNGPDLKVYLRADNDEFVSLGALKGNIGNQNYEIPVDTDLEVFGNVEIWCERFGVSFGQAELAAS